MLHLIKSLKFSFSLWSIAAFILAGYFASPLFTTWAGGGGEEEVNKWSINQQKEY